MSRIVTPLPDHPHYLWQMVVQAHWLRSHGWAGTWLVYCPTGSPSRALSAIMASGIGEVHAWPMLDLGAYHAAAKPWLVGLYLSAHAELADESMLVIDPDCLPLRSWPDAIPGVLLGTDTDSYTGPAYLQSKGCWEPLCKLVGVDPDRASAYLGVGAQYVTRGLSGSWWQDVARTSIAAHQMLVEHPSDVQAWCAEMYVTQLCAIRDGIEPRIAPDMSMVWADGPASGWDTAGFFHDAGVQEPRPGAFHKGSHQGWPQQIPPVDPDLAAARYVDLIHEAADAWPRLATYDLTA